MKKTFIVIAILLNSLNFNAQTVELGIDSLNYYESNFQYLKAINYIDKLFISEEVPSNILSKKAIYSKNIGKNLEAEDIYRELFKRDSSSISAGIDLALILSKQKKYKEAEFVYENLVEVDEYNFYLNRNLAQIYNKTKKPYKAIKCLKRNLEIDSTDLGTLSALSKLTYNQDHYKIASDFAQEGLKYHPENKSLLFTYAKAESKRKDYKRALDVMDRLLVQGDTLKEYIMFMGKCSYDNFEFDKTIFWFSKLVGGSDETDVINYYLAKSYEKTGNSERAIKHIKKAVELGISIHTPAYFKELAYSYVSVGEYDKAIKTWKQLNLIAKDNEYNFYIANIYETYKKDYKSALNYYSLFLKDPSSSKSENYELASSKVNEMKKELHLRGELMSN